LATTVPGLVTIVPELVTIVPGLATVVPGLGTTVSELATAVRARRRRGVEGHPFRESVPRSGMYEVEVKVAAEHDGVRDRLPEDAAALGTVEQVDTYFDAPHRDFADTDEALRLRRERRLDEGADVGDASDADGANVGDPEGADAGDPDGADAGDSDGAEAGDADGTGSGWTTAIAYKGPLIDAESKTREEFETTVADGEELEAALERLGFEPAAEVRKERDRYAIGELTVSLDVVEGLGEFVEVETEVERAGTERGSNGRDSKDGGDRPPSIGEAREAALSLLADLGCDPDEQIRTSYLGLLLEAR
jgi:adenylate cyclase class 2